MLILNLLLTIKLYCPSVIRVRETRQKGWAIKQKQSDIGLMQSIQTTESIINAHLKIESRCLLVNRKKGKNLLVLSFTCDLFLKALRLILL